jgi:hypothetical protein
MKRIAWIVGSFLLLAGACEQKDEDLASAEDRINEAAEDLIDDLTDPPNGWIVEYQPTLTSGIFLLFMDFDDEGNVTIRSDVSAEGGIYLNQTITYHVDFGLGTELIFDTYGVLHYLFEKNQNTFGAEFEFYFREKDGDNLIFQSKSDGAGGTFMTLEPASASDFQLLSGELISLLDSGSVQPNNLADVVQYQIHLESNNTSVFMTVDTEVRRLKVHGAAIGLTRQEMVANSNFVDINEERAFSLRSGRIVMNEAVSFSLGGNAFSISELALENFQSQDTSYCDGQSHGYVSFDGNLAGAGTFTMGSSLFMSHSEFPGESGELYLHSPQFIYNENDSSLINQIDEAFGELLGYVIVYDAFFNGYTGDDPFTGVGFVGQNDQGELEWFLRAFAVTEQTGNYLELALMDDTFINVSDSLAQREALFQITDEVFSGGVIYGTEVIAVDDLIQIFNPCNNYKGFLFKL